MEDALAKAKNPDSAKARSPVSRKRHKRQTMRTHANFKKYARIFLTVIAKARRYDGSIPPPAGFFHSYSSDKKDDTLSKTDRTPIAASFAPTTEKMQ